MTKTMDPHRLQNFKNIEAETKEVSDFYFHFIVKINFNEIEEATDEEMLNLPEKLGVFSFLSSEDENIYSETDGSPLE